MEPAVQAVLACQPGFPGYMIDLFACSRTLEDLFCFVRGIDKSFRILVQVVANIVFFLRRESSPTELIPDVQGYGHSFPEAYTTWESDVRHSESHQRIVRYQLAGLSCLVKFEADGYFKDMAKEDPEVMEAASSTKVDDLASQFAGLSSDVSSTQGHYRDDTSLKIFGGGQKIPRAAIFNLKSRAIEKRDQGTLDEELPRLWVSQISNFILAYHESGVFNDIQVRNVTQEIRDWERQNQAIIRRFALLLRKIISIVTGPEEQKVELHRQGLGDLEVRGQTKDVPHCLTSDTSTNWILSPEDLDPQDWIGHGGPFF
ncbi:MAG: hypothetical protein LQ351_004332 [Letrouitia transgressa]|nr:MAG: hypothetical protein LQ351_004332 [Letrouitia transgressa]